MSTESWPHSYLRASRSILSRGELNVHVAGAVGNPSSSIIRVVHISDTRGVHNSYAHLIPQGHILIHSGDFFDSLPMRSLKRSGLLKRPSYKGKSASCIDDQSTTQHDWRDNLRCVDDFFRRQPHPFKIFVPGCLDYMIVSDEKRHNRPTPREIQQHLPSVIYLEDAWCQLFGLRIYGVPWTSADDLLPKDCESSFTFGGVRSSIRRLMRVRSMRVPLFFRRQDLESDSARRSKTCNIVSEAMTTKGFLLPDIKAVSDKYLCIPGDVDILISHMPVWRPQLYFQVINRIRPTLHLCGHDFSGYGVTFRNDIVFSNASLQLTSTYPHVHHSRHRVYSTSRAESSPLRETIDVTTFSSSSAPHTSEVYVPSPVLNLPLHYKEPHLFDCANRKRPRRWRRLLLNYWSRLVFAVSQPFESKSTSGSHLCVPTSVYRTPSSQAALTVSMQGVFVSESYTAHESIMGMGKGTAYASSAEACRHPNVVDVYVVIEDDRIILPDYSETTSSPSAEIPGNREDEPIS